MKACPECGVGPGAYHRPTCYVGSVNYSDLRGRFWPPPTRRLLRWRDCGPTPEECERNPPPLRAQASGETTTGEAR